MSCDFTLKQYRRLLETLVEAGYEFHPVKESVQLQGEATASSGKMVFLRHDVDKKPENSLKIAHIESEMGIRATYYFRAVPCSWNEEIIREIAALGHEVGYHYESLTTCGGDVDAAYEDFKANLERLRRLADVATICMHGSPRSKYDSRDIWKRYDYKALGIIAEPYLDTDWSKTFYLTDTGRRWDGYKVSVRDRIPHWQEEWNRRGLTFPSTTDIIGRVASLPDKIMITTHPQRWSGSVLPWLVEFALQSLKNVVKFTICRVGTR